MRRVIRDHDVLLILDEIQAGIGRTGEMYAFESADIVPDAVPFSKAGGGGVPLSVLVYHERYEEWESGAHVGTFRGHQEGTVAGGPPSRPERSARTAPPPERVAPPAASLEVFGC